MDDRRLDLSGFELPEAVDLRGTVTVRDQGALGSSVGFAAVAALRMAMAEQAGQRVMAVAAAMGFSVDDVDPRALADLGVSMRTMMSAVNDTPPLTLDEVTWLHGAWCTVDAEGWVIGARQPYRLDYGGRFVSGVRHWLAGWGPLADEVPTSGAPGTG